MPSVASHRDAPSALNPSLQEDIALEQLRSSIHARYRENARCAVEVVTKLVYLVVLVGLASGAFGDLPEGIKAYLAATLGR